MTDRLDLAGALVDVFQRASWTFTEHGDALHTDRSDAEQYVAGLTPGERARLGDWVARLDAVLPQTEAQGIVASVVGYQEWQAERRLEAMHAARARRSTRLPADLELHPYVREALEVNDVGWLRANTTSEERRLLDELGVEL